MNAHRNDPNVTLQFFKLEKPDWQDAVPPSIETGRTTGSLRGCNYCGSMHPADLAAAIKAGAKLSAADRKYGWPHKFYVDGVPNPHAGMLESRVSQSHPPQQEIDAGKWVQIPDGFDRQTGEPVFRWAKAGEPAAATTSGKFYTEHLQDADEADREVIERAMGLNFSFEYGGGVSWKPVKP